jgi:hypothetical protein
LPSSLLLLRRARVCSQKITKFPALFLLHQPTLCSPSPASRVFMLQHFPCIIHDINLLLQQPGEIFFHLTCHRKRNGPSEMISCRHIEPCLLSLTQHDGFSLLMLLIYMVSSSSSQRTMRNFISFLLRRTTTTFRSPLRDFYVDSRRRGIFAAFVFRGGAKYHHRYRCRCRFCVLFARAMELMEQKSRFSVS